MRKELNSGINFANQTSSESTLSSSAYRCCHIRSMLCLACSISHSIIISGIQTNRAQCHVPSDIESWESRDFLERVSQYKFDFQARSPWRVGISVVQHYTKSVGQHSATNVVEYHEGKATAGRSSAAKPALMMPEPCQWMSRNMHLHISAHYRSQQPGWWARRRIPLLAIGWRLSKLKKKKKGKK